MNLEATSHQKKPAAISEDFSMDDFDFKPITSGLGFHQPKASEVKPVFTERAIPAVPVAPMSPAGQIKQDMQVYQNDLSMFYGQQAPAAPVLPAPEVEEKVEKTYRLASRVQRVSAYLVDLVFVLAILSGVLLVMAEATDMNLIETWQTYPHEITPLVVTLFIGFYMMYFSIFEKGSNSTLGKNLFNIKVVSLSDRQLSFPVLLVRSAVGLLNFLSLGLFSYFDLQNKITGSKMVRVD